MNKLLFLFSFFIVSSAFAESKLGYVDIDKVVSNTEEGKKAFLELKTDFETKQTELKVKAEDLQKKVVEINSNKKLKIEEKQKKLEALQAEYQKNVALEKEYKIAFDKHRDDVMNNINKKVNEVLTKLVKQENVDFLFNVKCLIIAPNAVDYTFQAIRLYDTAYPVEQKSEAK